LCTFGGITIANLRGGIRPYMSTGAKKLTTRLASEEIEVFADTWTRHVKVNLSKDGRLSITVKDGSYNNNKTIVDVELPSNDEFTPIIRTIEGIETELIK